MHGACFALCFFAFQLTEFTVNDRAAAVLGADMVDLTYSLGLICTLLGFLSFSLLLRIFEGEAARKTVLCLVGAVAVASCVILLAADSAAAFVASSFAALLLLGNIGGCVYYNLAMAAAGSGWTGRVVGVGMCAAVLLQFCVQNFFVTEQAFVISVALSVAVLVIFVVKPPRDWVFENPLPYSAENRTNKRAAWAFIIAVVLMSLVVSLIDGVVVVKHAEGQLSVSSYARLFYAASLVIAGFTADFAKGKYFSLAAACVILLSTVSAAFLASEQTFFLGTAVMYFYCGFYVIFLTVKFLDFAPQTKNPALWAGFGRVLRSAVTAAAAVPAVLVYGFAGNAVLIAASCVLSIAVLLVLLREICGCFVPAAPPEVVTEAAPARVLYTREEALRLYSAHYELTPREADVLTLLITTEDDNQTIADHLFISRRVLQR